MKRLSKSGNRSTGACFKSGRNFNSHLGEQSDDERLTNVDGCNCLLRISCHPSKKVGIIDTIKPPKRWQDLQIFETDIPRKLIS
ncbi:hypothetical protein Plhal304r1_c011g0041731 [Plasmopara halstedii]